MLRCLNHHGYRRLMRIAGWIASPALCLLGILKPDQQRRWRQMRGHYRSPELPPKGSSQRLWIHAVSVGEVGLAFALIRALRAQAEHADMEIILSTTTITSQARALAEAPEDVLVIHFPLDVPAFVARALDSIAADRIFLLETELWPNLIHQATARGISIHLLNGRISVRSFDRYLRLPRLLKPTLENISGFCMISEADAARIRQLGAPAHRVRVGGNAKFDALAYRREIAADKLPELRKVYALTAQQPVFVAGCTRRGEEADVVRMCQAMQRELPGILFIWAPRHPQFTRHAVDALRASGMPFVLRSALSAEHPRPPQQGIVLVDTIGELFHLYGLADQAFSGGSLIPKGGHNFLEIAVWGIPPLYGPSFNNFSDAHELLQRHQTGFCLPDCDAIAATALRLLKDPQLAGLHRQRCNAAIAELGTHAQQQISAAMA